MKYHKTTFPDGQISIELDYQTAEEQVVKRRINSYEDLFILKSITDALKQVTNGSRKAQLFIPCLFGQRSDRRFKENQSFDLKNICDFINSCDFEKVIVFDPHSDVTLGLLNNSTKTSSFQFVNETIYKLDRHRFGETVLVAPDAGAYKKVFDYSQKLELPLVGAVKHRTLDGKFTLQCTGDVKYKECLIVDDLADGGGTFVVLGKKLKELGASKVSLYVSHGYFNKGFDELKQYIDHIYCTNSVKDMDDSYVTQYKII